MRVAAIDCGTNSIRLLVAEAGADGRLQELYRQLQLVRLGQGVDATGRFDPQALQRTLAATADFARVIAEYSVPAERTRFVATSAARDAANSEEFFDGVRALAGVEAEIISGDEEARLSFAGALSGFDDAVSFDEPVLVTDIGGGSTELVVGTHGVLAQAVSLDIGSVRLRERLLPGDPPTEDERAATVAYIDQQLDSCGIDLSGVGRWIGVAGSVTSLAALALGLSSYDRNAVHRAELSIPEVRRGVAAILDSPVEDLIEAGPIQPRRAEVLAAGAMIIDRIAARVGAPALTVSESDILDGIAAALIRDSSTD